MKNQQICQLFCIIILSQWTVVDALSTTSKLSLPTYQDVLEASEILEGVCHRTPAQTSSCLNEELGVECYFKCENLQKIGAFKFRGAYNAISHLSKTDLAKGVLAFSSGNHAQAMAKAASMIGTTSTIVMPHDAPTSKVEATKGYGGTVVEYNRYTEDRLQIAKELQESSGAILIPPYDHVHVIAGQGTAGKELLEDAPELDYLLVPVGGGGLISGCALAATTLAPSCKVIGVEPEAGNDAQQSLKAGKIVGIETPQTIADGAQTQQIGQLNFGVMQELVDSIATVSDDELIQGMRFFGERMKLVVEPTGCLGLAGLRKLVENGTIPKGSRCGVIVTGGNVDVERHCQLLLGAEE